MLKEKRVGNSIERKNQGAHWKQKEQRRREEEHKTAAVGIAHRG
jgi:hypothetical protein